MKNLQQILWLPAKKWFYEVLLKGFLLILHKDFYKYFNKIHLIKCSERFFTEVFRSSIWMFSTTTLLRKTTISDLLMLFKKNSQLVYWYILRFSIEQLKNILQEFHQAFFQILGIISFFFIILNIDTYPLSIFRSKITMQNYSTNHCISMSNLYQISRVRIENKVLKELWMKFVV